MKKSTWRVEPEPVKSGPAPQHWFSVTVSVLAFWEKYLKFKRKFLSLCLQHLKKIRRFLLLDPDPWSPGPFSPSFHNRSLTFLCVGSASFLPDPDRTFFPVAESAKIRSGKIRIHAENAQVTKKSVSYLALTVTTSVAGPHLSYGSGAGGPKIIFFIVPVGIYLFKNIP